MMTKEYPYRVEKVYLNNNPVIILVNNFKTRVALWVSLCISHVDKLGF